MLDHLVLASPDPLATRTWLAERTGVSLSAGGSHVGMGTRNWLGSFGGGSYLELIGPDPDQAAPAAPRPFGVDDLSAPAMRGWCVRPEDLDAFARRATAAGVPFGAPFEMRRQAGDVTLRWRLSLPEVADDPTVPFAIDWLDSPHPSGTATGGLSLERFVLAHPAPDRVAERLAALGLDVTVESAGAPAIRVTLRGPAGAVEL